MCLGSDNSALLSEIGRQMSTCKVHGTPATVSLSCVAFRSLLVRVHQHTIHAKHLPNPFEQADPKEILLASILTAIRIC